ncbi:hypothetical protein IHE45_14G122200 [Dioscorea alata]|uniref:Uncharacterized protein n=1 Tax=Dioscorea alata TaxID=55571 RepID=A0ACB7UUV4_DIOAL|nr:hypothetical protein IHE45_14G122200 [Dioscorea alata]
MQWIVFVLLSGLFYLVHFFHLVEIRRLLTINYWEDFFKQLRNYCWVSQTVSRCFRIDITNVSLCTMLLPQILYSMGPTAQIIDVELDVTDDSKDTDVLTTRSSDTSVISLSPKYLEFINSFFPCFTYLYMGRFAWSHDEGKP